MNKLICATTIKKWMKFLKNEQNTKIVSRKYINPRSPRSTANDQLDNITHE